MFFKKNMENLSGLEKALDLGLITKKECLELRFKRAEEDLKNYSKIKISVKEVKTKRNVRL